MMNYCIVATVMSFLDRKKCMSDCVTNVCFFVGYVFRPILA